MKKLYFLLILISGLASAQIVNIPDANFKAKLLEADVSNVIARDNNYNSIRIDSNNDGEIDFSEANNVYHLNVGSSNITNIEGINAFVNLYNLSCTDNELSFVNILSLVNLNYFNCSSNQISDSNNIIVPNNLQKLLLRNNLFTNFNLNNLTNLIELDLNYNYQLSSIQLDGLLSLQKLYCINNNLNSLSITNSNIEEIDCANNQLTSLSFENFNSLKFLHCDGNNLINLNVSNCNNLRYINCSNNQLTNIDLSTTVNLESISASNNLFNYLDFSNCSFKHYWSNGNLTNIINPSFVNNPNLIGINFKNGNDNFNASWYGFQSQAFQGCPNLNYICVDSEYERTFLSSFLDINTVAVNSYCSFTPGGNFNTITGIIKYDSNNDGCNVNDANYPNIRININDGLSTGAAFTNSSGAYSFYTQNGDFILSPTLENPSWFNILPNNATILFPDNNNNTATQNFCITPNGIHPDLEIVVAPVFPSRPGFDAVYKIVYRNKGNQTLSQAYGINFFYNNNLMDLVSTSIAPTSVVSGGISWDYANLQPFESREILVTFNINAPTDTNPVNIDDVLTFTASILPQAGDENTTDNLYVYNETVVGSFDPNDITCLEGDVVSPAEIGDYLHYMIRFENTGTAEAENIVVRTEVNPADFDINSLQLLNTSHSVNAKITGNVVEFIFQNILLESGGHGNVLLKVKSKNTLQQGDAVNKRANIYFDYNYPVATNEAETIFQALSNPDFEQDQTISLYPNPTKDKVNISGDFTLQSVQLYDVQGRLLQIQLADGNQTVLDIALQSNGVYFIKVTSDKGIKVGKIVKE
jgi:uncharacterized repeat protein (TIGR01451 family)